MKWVGHEMGHPGMKWDGHEMAWHEMGPTWNGTDMKWDRRAWNGTNMKWDGHEMGQADMKWDGHDLGWTWNGTRGHEMGWTWNGSTWNGPTWNGWHEMGVIHYEDELLYALSFSFLLVLRVFLCFFPSHSSKSTFVHQVFLSWAGPLKEAFFNVNWKAPDE